MNSTAATYLPFDAVWKMRIDHPYSLLVKQDGILWSCGQCPLDSLGNVLDPNNLLKQAAAVAGFIRRFMGDMQSETAAIGRLIVYYVKTAPDDAKRLSDLFHQEFGQSVQIVPVAVPHFYYDGMMIEVDVFASHARAESSVFTDEEGGLTLTVTDAGPFLWATISAPPAGPQDIESRLSRLLARANLPTDALLAEQWFLPAGCDVLANGLRGSHIGSAVRVADADAGVLGELTFAKTPVSGGRESAPGVDEVSISLSMTKGYFYLTALDASPNRGLVEQTAKIMQAVEAVFARAGLGFKDVRKSITYYIAGNTADELHDNMSIRNGYYTKPGPASTGLPVEGLTTSQAQISVSLIGVIPGDDR